MTPAAIKGVGSAAPKLLARSSPSWSRGTARAKSTSIAWEAQTPRRGSRWEMNRSGSSSPSGSATKSAFGSGAPRESGAADMATRAHDAMIARTFDAAGWFWALSQHGRVAMLTGDRLWVGRISPLDREAVQALDQPPLSLHTPGAGNALAGLLRGKCGWAGIIFHSRRRWPARVAGPADPTVTAAPPPGSRYAAQPAEYWSATDRASRI